MEIIYAPGGLVGTRRPGQGVWDMTRAGFQDILLDFSMFCPPGEMEAVGKKRKETGLKDRVLVSEHPSELYNSAKTVLEQYRKACLRVSAARAPYLPGSTKREDLNGLLMVLAEESIRICGRAGCRCIIVNPLISGITGGDLWEANREYYLRLAETAKVNGVTILLENQCRDMNGHMVRGICSEPDEAVSWVDRLNGEAGEERFGFCMDVGACNLCGQNMQEFAAALGSRIRAVILRDCDGYREASMLPFTCSGFERTNTDWLGLIRGLREIMFDGYLIFDFSTTASFFSPLLRPQLMQLAKGVAEYFKWQIGIESLLAKYGSVVLFGAGNMCRNYMKCYGEKYPPLYTCDNNRNLWGAVFCGLEVKPPESLKDLPEDCAILICNVYYREIERQLQEMGVSNPVEFFSDEFMPSFYYDRLERD